MQSLPGRFTIVWQIRSYLKLTERNLEESRYIGKTNSASQCVPKSAAREALREMQAPPLGLSVLRFLSPAVLSVGSQSPPDASGQGQAADGRSDSDADCGGFAERDAESMAKAYWQIAPLAPRS